MEYFLKNILHLLKSLRIIGDAMQKISIEAGRFDQLKRKAPQSQLPERQPRRRTPALPSARKRINLARRMQNT